MCTHRKWCRKWLLIMHHFVTTGCWSGLYERWLLRKPSNIYYTAKVFGHLYITHTGAVGPWKPKPKGRWCTAVLIVKPAESAERSRSVCHGGFQCFHLQLIKEYQEAICQICFMHSTSVNSQMFVKTVCMARSCYTPGLMVFKNTWIQRFRGVAQYFCPGVCGYWQSFQSLASMLRKV